MQIPKLRCWVAATGAVPHLKKNDRLFAKIYLSYQPRCCMFDFVLNFLNSRRSVLIFHFRIRADDIFGRYSQLNKLTKMPNRTKQGTSANYSQRNQYKPFAAILKKKKNKTSKLVWRIVKFDIRYNNTLKSIITLLSVNLLQSYCCYSSV